VTTLDQADANRFGPAPDFLRLINNGPMSQAVCVAAELGIADLLACGPRHVNELARATASHAPSLHRLLRALASLELCVQDDDGLFALTPLGSLLRADASNSLRSWTIWCGKYMWPVWANLLYSVKTGESARKLVTGSNDFGHLERDEASAAVFNCAMAELTRLVADEMVRVYDFSAMERIVDVGGGYGALLAAILEANENMHGVLLDRPHALDGARTNLDKAGVASRCEFVVGNFFESVPAGADAYLLKAVLHDWDDEKSGIILRNCCRVMPSGGKLLVVERILPTRLEASSQHHAIARADLTMLVALGGRERSEAEFRALLGSSGFHLARVIATGLEYSVLEGVPC
jgi:ubiquinone/menaquinone biosynthesis C-methylase UbiE